MLVGLAFNESIDGVVKDFIHREQIIVSLVQRGDVLLELSHANVFIWGCFESNDSNNCCKDHLVVRKLPGNSLPHSKSQNSGFMCGGRMHHEVVELIRGDGLELGRRSFGESFCGRKSCHGFASKRIEGGIQLLVICRCQNEGREATKQGGNDAISEHDALDSDVCPRLPEVPECEMNQSCCFDAQLDFWFHRNHDDGVWVPNNAP